MSKKLGKDERRFSCPIGRLALTSYFVLIATCGAADRMGDLITRASAFPQPIVWVGAEPPQEAESKTLLHALRTAEDSGREAGLTALERFVVEHPGSPWTPSL